MAVLDHGHEHLAEHEKGEGIKDLIALFNCSLVWFGILGLAYLCSLIF